MANRFPLIANASANQIQELASGDFLDLSQSGISNSGNISSSGIISATGNIVGGNILTAGLISATSTITGNSFSGAGTGLTGTASSLTVGSATTAGTVTTAAQPNITSVGTLSSVAITGNVDAGNLRTTGLISATGTITGTGITGTSLTVSTGNVSCGNIVNTNANGVGNIGSATTYFNTVFAKATSAQYADLAEKYTADADYEPGTVVVFGGNNEVSISTSSHDIHVAGVVSTNPSYLMNASQQGTHVVAVALQGRVPCRVIGQVRKGDRMVSSSTPGVAQALDPAKYEPGCIIGKALSSYDPVFDKDGNEIPGVVEVVVGRI